MSDSEDEYGPPLPPGLSKTNKSSDDDDDSYGPAMPPELHSGSQSAKRRRNSASSSSDDDTYGPALPAKSSNTISPKPPPYHSNNSSDSDSDSSSDSDTNSNKTKRQKTTCIGPAIPDHLNKKEDNSYIGPELPPHLSKAKETVDGISYIGPTLPPQMSKAKETVEDDNYIGPELPSQMSKAKDAVEVDNHIGPELPPLMGKTKQTLKDDSYIGPELPPHMGKAKDSKTEDSKHIGPTLPPHLRHLESAAVSGDDGSDSPDSDDGMVGPSLALQATGSELSSAMEFEMRAQKMHDKLTGKKVEDSESEAPIARESWMTELPSGVNKQYGLVNRNFRRKDAPEQDTSWTDTPHDKAKKDQEGSEAKKRKNEDKYYIPTEKERKTAKEIDNYNKTNRPDSLLAMHEKKLKKKKKKEKKEKKKNKKDKKQEERRPFDRDLDLQVNKLDDAQRKAMIKRSQELNSRFKTGGVGTSFL